MTTPAPKLPPGWGPRPHGRPAHDLFKPLYDWAGDAAERLDDLESRSGTSVAGIVPTYADLPTGPRDGQAFIVQDETAMYVRSDVLDDWVGPVPVQGAATEAAVAAAVQTPTVLNALTRLGSRPVGRGEAQVNVRDHGAKGDNTGDDGPAIQAAVDEATARGVPVYLPGGRYRVTTSIALPEQITIRGDSAPVYPFRTIPFQAMPWIESTAQNLFVPKPGVTQIDLRMTGLRLRNVHAALADATCFYGMTLRGSTIEGNVLEEWGTILGPIGGAPAFIFMSRFVGNRVVNVRKQFNTGAFIDSNVESNYIKGGSGTNNPTCFVMDGWATTTIANNFIDFFKVIFDARNTYNTVTIIGNRLEFSFRVLKGYIQRLVFVGNTIRFVRAATLANFPTADAQMTAGPWVAIDTTGAGARHFAASANMFVICDGAFRFRDWANYDLQVRGNSYYQVTDPINFSVFQTQEARDGQDIYLDALEDREVTTLPPAAVTGTHSAYHKQRIIFNGLPVININGVWKKYDGTNA